MKTLIGSCKKTKVSCTGWPPSARSIYSWSRVNTIGLYYPLNGDY